MRDWLRHLYEASREKAALYEIELPAFEEFWEQGYVRGAAPARAAGQPRRFRADPVAFPLGTPSGRIEIYSERIASFGYDDCPGHPVWQEPAEWLGVARGGALSAASHLEPAAHQAAQPVRPRRGEPRQQDQGTRADRDASGGCGRARA